MSIRVPVAVVAFLMFAFAFTARAAGAAPASLDITARRVDFYYNRFIVTADGDVRVRLSDGTVVRGETFSMDLRLNRYLVAGAVQLQAPRLQAQGAAFAGYPDLDRAFFLPEAPSATAEPERWTFFGDDWTDRHENREQPGDAYAIPDVTAERPYIKASSAEIIPRTSVRFEGAQIYAAGAYVPQPRYVVEFGSNSHFYENAFFGSRFDVGVPFNGSAHSLSALHVRNDQYNGTYLAFDQHFVWDRDWIVFGVDPLTQEERQYNLIGYKRFSPNLEARLFVQETAAQKGAPIYGPGNAAAYSQVIVAAALRRSNVSYLENNYYQYILGLPYGLTNTAVATADYDPRWREHPTDMHLSWTGWENRLTHGTVPLLFRLRSGLDLGHDQYGLWTFPGQPSAPDIWGHYYGATFYTPGISLPHHLTFNSSYDAQYEYFSTPHHTSARDLRFTLAGSQERRHVAYFLTYETQTVGDNWGKAQNLVYGYNPSFQGYATFRQYLGSLIYTPTPYVGVNLQLSRHYDYPGPVPFVYGQPPWQFAGDVRFRLARTVQVDLTRQYYFNFANLRWTPQFGIQFSP